MAQFRATIKGHRGEASRLGTKASGLTAEVNGWDLGIKVIAEHHNGEDEFFIYQTSGSNNRHMQKFLCKVTSKEVVFYSGHDPVIIKMKAE